MFELQLTADVTVSFQRYPYPPAGRLDRLPTSYGALPIADLADGEVVIPAPAGEAVWIGLLAVTGQPAEVRVLAHIAGAGVVNVADGSSGSPGDAGASFALPPHQFVPGLFGDAESWSPIARAAPDRGQPDCEALELAVVPGPSALRVGLLDEDTFVRLSGLPVPRLHPGSAYSGRRLP